MLSDRCNLAIRPLIEAGLVDTTAGIVCDAKSGVSGAGRKATLKTHFCEVTENFSAYSILDHRHVPEVLLISGIEERDFSFTAQLLPLDRGILETVYSRAVPGTTADDIARAYADRYATERIVPPLPTGRGAGPEIRPANQLLATSASVSTRTTGVRLSCRHRQPRQRRGRASCPEHEPYPRVRRDGGTALKAADQARGHAARFGGIAGAPRFRNRGRSTTDETWSCTAGASR